MDINKKQKSKSKKNIFLLLMGSSIILFGLYKMFYGYKIESEIYFKNFKIEMKGIVITKKIISHGAGYVCLDIKETSINDYNPSDSLTTYYCLIKNKRAILCESGISTFEIGDTYVVSSEKDSCYLYDEKGLLKWSSILSKPDWIKSPKSFDLCN